MDTLGRLGYKKAQRANRHDTWQKAYDRNRVKTFLLSWAFIIGFIVLFVALIGVAVTK